jgi:hypothetical protein
VLALHPLDNQVHSVVVVVAVVAAAVALTAALAAASAAAMTGVVAVAVAAVVAGGGGDGIGGGGGSGFSGHGRLGHGCKAPLQSFGLLPKSTALTTVNAVHQPQVRRGLYTETERCKLRVRSRSEREKI